MTLEERIEAFARLGSFLSDYVAGNAQAIDGRMGEGIYSEFHAAVLRSEAANHWFTQCNIEQSISAIASTMLQRDILERWLAAYPQLKQVTAKMVGIVMAGNIPLVGFHDLLCVLVSGHSAVIKPSSKDSELIKEVCHILVHLAPEFAHNIHFSGRNMPELDALLATGSNNSARYFESEFGAIPKLVRKNRFSVAVLSGNETMEQLQRLSNDIFDYFGLGCRNISNLMVPGDYDFTPLLTAMAQHAYVMNHADYADCYRYQNAVLTLQDTPYITNGFVLLREQAPSFSSIALLNYLKYTTFESVKKLLEHLSGSIQCIVCEMEGIDGSTPLGTAQQPDIDCYADNLDTLEFLSNN